MPRIHPLEIAHTPAAVADTLEVVQKKLGAVPNVFRTFAHSPAVLNSYLVLSEALSHGLLTARQREVIALAIGQKVRCGYCVAAHTMIGKGAGLSDAEIAAARHGEAQDPVEQAIATLALQLHEQGGNISDTQFQAAQAAGLNDGQILEVVANLALNFLTNSVNHVADTEIDFPKVEL